MKLYTIILKDAKGLQQAAEANTDFNKLALPLKHLAGRTYSNMYIMDFDKFADRAMTDGSNIFLLDEIESKIEQ